MTRPVSAETLLSLVDQCVMCGLCLPHCPTYAIAQDEAESPRGRIALARAVAGGRIDAGADVFEHMDQCLACRACETACPSNVAYERILIEARALIEPRRARPSLVHRLAGSPWRLSLLARMAGVTAAAAWLPWLLRGLPASASLRRLADALPRQPALPRFSNVPATPPARSRIALFEGCVAGSFDRDTLAATRHLLLRLGHDVVGPPSSLCCGALPRHAGAAASAAQVAAETRKALEALGSSSVAISATGCHGALTDSMAGSGIDVLDAIRLVARDDRIDRLRFRPLPLRAALHLPCSQINGSGSADDLRDLLARIPGLTVLELPVQPRCCGAAGSYFLEHPGIADTLRDGRIDQVDAQAPDLLLTSNIGCRIHLANGLRQRGRAVPVLHPLTLLAQQLEDA